MKIDESTFERVMEDTPIEKLNATWRIIGFTTARRWCDAAKVMGQREGAGVGMVMVLVPLAVINGILAIFDVEAGWLGVVSPLMIAFLIIPWTTGNMRNHRLYMYGGKANGCDLEQSNASAADEGSDGEPGA